MTGKMLGPLIKLREQLGPRQAWAKSTLPTTST